MCISPILPEAKKKLSHMAKLCSSSHSSNVHRQKSNLNVGLQSHSFSLINLLLEDMDARHSVVFFEIKSYDICHQTEQ